VSLYLYGVLAAEPPPAPRGSRLRYVSCGGLFAVVRALDRLPAAHPAALRRHAAVVQRLWDAAPAVVPARFGSAVADEAELLRELQARLPDLRAALELVRGRAQMTLRVFDTTVKKPGASAGEPASGRAFLAARAAWWRGADVPGLPALLEAVRPLRAAERIERHQAPPLAASVYHLVDRGRVAEYRSVVARRRGRMRLRVSGPWPPYAFAPGVGA
jgi:hypothetical protein